MKNRRPVTRTFLVVFALFAVTAFSACSSSPEEASEPAADEPISADSPPASPEAATNEAGALIVSAPINSISTGFDPAVLDAPADQEFTLTFNNDDTGIPHNIQVFEGEDTTDKVLWAPEEDAVITGPDSVEYEIAALPAGTYAFNCYVHPTMVGTITVA